MPPIRRVTDVSLPAGPELPVARLALRSSPKHMITTRSITANAAALTTTDMNVVAGVTAPS